MQRVTLLFLISQAMESFRLAVGMLQSAVRVTKAGKAVLKTGLDSEPHDPY